MAFSWLLEPCRLYCNNKINCDSNVNRVLARGLILDFSEVRLSTFPPYFSAGSEGRMTYGNDVLKSQSCADFSLPGQGQHQAVSGRDFSSVIYTPYCAPNRYGCWGHRSTQTALKTFFFPRLIPISPDFILVMTGNAGFCSSPSIPLTLTRHGLHLNVYLKL